VSEPALRPPGEADPVAAYKRIFKAVIDQRPSGMRLKLALAMGKNRSFISQLANPAYQVPIPAQHLETIFQVCHFSPAEKAAFLAAYRRAHPSRTGRPGGAARERALTLHLPELGSRKRNGQLDALLQELARRLASLLQEKK
jgi:hypothetical protein